MLLVKREKTFSSLIVRRVAGGEAGGVDSLKSLQKQHKPNIKQRVSKAETNTKSNA